MKKMFTSFLLLCFSSLAISQTPTLVATGSMAKARWFHRTHLLNNGKVLTFGGDNANAQSPEYYNSAELYNPTTGTWSATGSMNQVRSKHTSQILNDGKVLAIGGKDQSLDAQTSCEIYNTTTGTWTYTGSLSAFRSEPASVIFPNGKVLVVGGEYNGSTQFGEIYDPTLGTWSNTSDMIYYHGQSTSAILLADGRVLVTGGNNASPDSDVAEIYTPITNTWIALPNMNSARFGGHNSVQLDNGKVLIYGATATFGTKTTEIFDPIANTFTLSTTNIANRSYCPPIKLTDGRILVYGIGNSFSANTAVWEFYNYGSGIWSAPSTNTIGASVYTATRLQNGSILICGGNFATGNGALKVCGIISNYQAVEINETELNVNFSLYPNPSTSKFNIEIDSKNLKANFTADIINLEGNKVQENIILNNGLNEINVQNINPGIYFLSIKDSHSEIKVERLIIQ